MYMYCSSRYYFISFIMKKIKGGKGMGMFSIGEGYNETEKPEKYAKFHYI